VNTDDVRAAWIALSSEHLDDSGLRVSELETSTADGPLLIGRDRNGTMHLLVPVGRAIAVPTDDRTAHVRIGPAELVVNERPRSFIDVSCNEPRFSDAFQRLAIQVVERIDATPLAALVAPYDVLARWRDFFEPRRRALTANAIVGLFGELSVLERLVERDPFRRVEHWVGPTGAPHDFQVGTNSFEIKTTGVREGLVVEIHGVEQLEHAPGNDLYLTVLRIDRDEHGRTISDLLDSLESTGANRAHLRDLTRLIGWDEANPSDERFLLAEQRWYRVDEAFPKIVQSSFVGGRLPAGTLRLRYDVDLTGPSPSHLDDAEVETLISRSLGVPQ
jgi:hypothetical protein